MPRTATRLARARQWVLALATAAAAAYLAQVVITDAGTPDHRIRLVFALKLFLVLAIGFHWSWTRDRTPNGLTRLSALCERHAPLLVLAVIVGTDAVVLLTTPQIAFGEGRFGVGYGHDGVAYGSMTEDFTWFGHRAPGYFAYRWLPPMLVHYSGLSTFAGFKLLNLASHALATFLVYRVALHFSPSRTVAVLAAALFAVLKFGIKFLLYYPVLADGLGLALLMLIVWSTIEERHVIYVLAMMAATACRENLLALTLFNALYTIRTARGGQRFVRAALLQVAPWAAFVLTRRFPVFQATNDQAVWVSLEHWWRAFLNDPLRQHLAALAYLNSLGILAILPVVWWRRVAAVLVERYEWAAFVAASIGVIIGGGLDWDRYVVCLAPFAVVAVVAARPWRDPPPRIWLYWLGIHATAMELFLPWSSDEHFYLSRTAVRGAVWDGGVYDAVFSWTLVALVLAMEVDEPEP